MAIVEAIYCRTLPLLPRRLVYPEILPKDAHGPCLYSGRREMLEKLRTLLTRRFDFDSLLDQLSMAMERFAWHHRIKEFDRLFSEVVSGGVEKRRPAQEKARELAHSPNG